ncbi:restriction endonuclease subunit S [Pelagicoccus sp. SDUM812005]|uniref:restriction endonuclease subunit S n=1 Tax=Pelagicoccus sp. SDUM812005 TaxID=3041257 RepID=UPI00280DCD7B|nr:restriction endonuclease subunit S [Pelagicoccus sp. SDUM812005]MDQ8182213.1 restriction endonuclease subunit S [Pelagicoccus sp. SDUM812005]
MSKLPKGWMKVPLRKITEPISKGPPDSDFVYVDIASIDNQSKRIVAPKELTASQAPSRARQHLKAGDVLVSMTRPNLNAVAIVPDTLDNSIGSTGFDVLRSTATEPAWLFSHVKSTRFVDSMVSLVQGALYPAVKSADVRSYEIELPPANEQKRIVKKLEACEGRINTAREALDEVPSLLDQYRQSVLAAAFRGDLTKKWRQQNPDIEPIENTIENVTFQQSKSGRSASDAVIDGRAAIAVGKKERPAPPGWKWVPLLKVARMESGHTPSRSHPEWWGGDIPWIGIKDARDGHGKTILATNQYTNELGLANSASRLLPEGTVCLSRTASVGYVTKMGKPMATSQDFANWICSDALEPEFLQYALMAEGDDIRNFGKGTTHTTIYFPELKAFQICIPPVEEQKVISQKVRRALETIEKCEAEMSSSLNETTQLIQRVLSRAFSGRLVPQDPDDEPASKLIEKIKEDQANAPQKKRATKRVTKKARNKKLMKIQLEEALSKANSDLSPNDLFSLSGYKPDEVEEFYADLKKAIDSKSILEDRSDEQNPKLRLAKAS